MLDRRLLNDRGVGVLVFASWLAGEEAVVDFGNNGGRSDKDADASTIIIKPSSAVVGVDDFMNCTSSARPCAAFP